MTSTYDSISIFSFHAHFDPFTEMSVGTFTGAAIPLIMRRFGADPAQASAIFLIMVTDAIAFSTLLGFAYIAKTWMQGS